MRRTHVADRRTRTTATLLSAGMLVLMLCSTAPASVFSWDGGGDGTSWNDPDNWYPPGIPSATDDVEITLAATYTVVITGSTGQAASLTLGAGSGSQTLDVDDVTLTVAGNTDIVAGGTLLAHDDVTIGGALDVAFDGALIIDNGDVCCEIVIDVGTGVTNDGLIRLTSSVEQDGTLAVTSGAITNNAGGTIDLDAGAGGSRTIQGDLSNAGRLTITAASLIDGALAYVPIRAAEKVVYPGLHLWIGLQLLLDHSGHVVEHLANRIVRRAAGTARPRNVAACASPPVS